MIASRAAPTIALALALLLPTTARAGICHVPKECLCRPGFIELVVHGEVVSVAPSGSRVRVLEVAASARPFGLQPINPGEVLTAPSKIQGTSLRPGDRVLLPVEPVSTDAGLKPLLREYPLLLDSQDRAICFSQPSIRIPRQEATRVLLANDGGKLCLSTLISYGLSPSSEDCGYGDSGPCAMGANPRAFHDLIPWPLLVLLWLRRRT